MFKTCRDISKTHAENRGSLPFTFHSQILTSFQSSADPFLIVSQSLMRFSVSVTLLSALNYEVDGRNWDLKT